ncbi:hypothetical protein COCC4DRAFT_67698 [Bipolaris maydis ATCC 48331]|uniref:DUF676 domain-containing protein n=2 Tax=Cochliobolus heterostrophus TaxID=5016 RepID=M2UBF8_COCH5|nr:uncharacterized protein COCC4DRAFT_67698 [Bipolaris maydis ATCC 48331]EMD95884.1 hypothetical protein COCHEDRAFT_1221573 [Bipolaris maydis C5]ENI10744.1 hypothetical protein COCC4DRAFT_67698 [Bipolaris maydis ATCC 48331]KAJ6200815.1 hypothetical protein J3E72DRAFT_383324 [Bipolaris maydis]KAJ6274565.1 hypothetical protein PSV08DRAFT_194829 [Bipolaris maydis]
MSSAKSAGSVLFKPGISIDPATSTPYRDSETMDTVSARLDPNEAYLHLIANPENALLDIIAVHGMNVKNDRGHSNKTWTHEGSGTHWLRDPLPSNAPQARIMTYQYNANVMFDSSTAGVQEQAENLLQLISVKRENARSRPIIFIAHSLGGIIVKQALATAYNAPSGEHAAIYVFTFALFLFGVPHQGSGVPRKSWASIVRQIFQLGGYSTNTSFLNSVTEDSNYAEQLRDSFKPLLNFYNVFTVCETKELDYFGIIVPKESARLGASSEDVFYPNRCHRTICKFRDSDDPVWQHVSEMLSRAAERAVKSTYYSSVSDTREAMIYQLSTNFGGTMVVSRQNTQSITKVIEQAEKITEKHQAGHSNTKDLDIVVQAQNADMSGYVQSWGGIILAVLSIISGFWLPSLAVVAVSAIPRLPSPVVVT